MFNEIVEVDLKGRPFGVNIEIVDRQGVSGAIAPPGAYYRITFYKPGEVADHKEKPIRTIEGMPGAVYLTEQGVVITGSRPDHSHLGKQFIDYQGR